MPQQNPNGAQQLSQAIAQARSGRTMKTDDLDRFRAVLLKERKAGAPVRALKAGLDKIGIAVSEETLRTWLIANGDPKQRAASPAPKTKQALAPSTPRKPASAAAASVPTPPPAQRGHGPRVARDDI